MGVRGRPYPETSRDQGGANGKQSGLAHLSLPSNQLSAATCGSSSRLMGRGMPDYGFGRCDGHHEMVDLRLTNPLAVEPPGSLARRTRQDVRTHPIKARRDL